MMEQQFQCKGKIYSNDVRIASIEEDMRLLRE